MKFILTGLTLLAVCTTTRGQTQTLKKSERPVFYTAKALADDCQKFFKVFPEGRPLDDTKMYKLNPDDLAGAVKCQAYVAGMSDGMIEDTFGPRYHPVKTELENFGTLVSTFIK